MDKQTGGKVVNDGGGERGGENDDGREYGNDTGGDDDDGSRPMNGRVDDACNPPRERP